MEARIIRDRTPMQNHKGCAFLKCLNFHEAENILRIHRQKKCEPSDLRGNKPQDSDDEMDNRERRKRQRAKIRTEEDYDNLPASEYYDMLINEKISVKYADCELERLGIVNIDPFDLNG